MIVGRVGGLLSVMFDGKVGELPSVVLPRGGGWATKCRVEYTTFGYLPNSIGDLESFLATKSLVTLIHLFLPTHTIVGVYWLPQEVVFVRQGERDDLGSPLTPRPRTTCFHRPNTANTVKYIVHDLTVFNTTGN